jgi:hypothetical protein
MQSCFLSLKTEFYLKPNREYLKGAFHFVTLTLANSEILLGSNMQQSIYLSLFSLIAGHLERVPVKSVNTPNHR